ncbi:GDP-L-fucose synthase [Candidatus Acetothermia bacterium]|jgi:GDP-L-fucose synthase|nr:GDP-L-fucose synthase [Candidatus Acetothermia bacterium]
MIHDLKSKKILVTGGAGFVGSFVVEKLLEGGVAREDIFIPRSADLDLRKWGNCQRAVKGQDIVIHLAANVGGIGYNQYKPGELFYDNLSMGIHLMEAARQTGVEKFVSIGSICSYPKFAPVPFKEENLWKGYPEETNAAYGLAKLMALVQSQAYRQQYGFHAIHLLMVNLYGPRDKFNLASGHVIPSLIRKIYQAKRAGKNFIEAWGTGKATREFLYVEDAAEGIVLATEYYDKPDPVNLGSGMEISIQDLVVTIARLMDFHGEIRWDTAKPDGQPRRRLDVSRAEKEFGFRPETTLEEGLKRTIQWWGTEGRKIYGQ